MSSHLNWEFNYQLINGGREIDCVLLESLSLGCLPLLRAQMRDRK